MNAPTSFKPTEERLTLHGLGFLQLQLAANQRLHVWHPDLPRRRCFEHSSIHDHRFGFVSRVLVGVQNNVVYRHVQVPTTHATHIAYLHEGERTRFGNRPWIFDGGLFIDEPCTQQLRAGEQYYMPPYVFHSTEPGGDGRVATLMSKTSEGERGAHSLCKVGVEPDADFDRKQWGEESLWAIVQDVLGGWPA